MSELWEHFLGLVRKASTELPADVSQAMEQLATMQPADPMSHVIQQLSAQMLPPPGPPGQLPQGPVHSPAAPMQPGAYPQVPAQPQTSYPQMPMPPAVPQHLYPQQPSYPMPAQSGLYPQPSMPPVPQQEMPQATPPR